MRLKMICSCCLLHLLAFEVLQCGDALSRTFGRLFVRGHDDAAQRQAPARQVRDGGTYEGEWLNGKKLRER